MPFKSRQQQRYFEWLNEKGKLPQSVNLKEWEDATDHEDLPEHMFEGGIAVDRESSPRIDYAGDSYHKPDVDADLKHREMWEEFNSNGEPHTNDKLSDEQDMEFMNKGGFVRQLRRKRMAR